MPAPIIALGLTAGQLAALGIQGIMQGIGIASSAGKANEQARLAMDSKRSGQQMIEKAKKRIEASNYSETLAVNKELTDKALDALLASQAGYNLGATDQRFAASGAPEMQKGLIKGLETFRDAEAKQRDAIREKIVEGDTRIAEQLASIELGEANQQFAEAQDAATMKGAYDAQTAKMAGELGATALEAFTPSIVSGIDNAAMKRQLSRNVGEAGAKDYFQKQFAGYDPAAEDDKGRKGFEVFATSGVSNPALQQEIIKNPEFGKTFADLAIGENTKDDQITNFLLENLDPTVVSSIIKGLPGRK